MRIGNLFQGQAGRSIIRTHYEGRAETFQNILTAQTENCKSDTVNISSAAIQQVPIKENSTAMADQDIILPTDPVQVKLTKLQNIAKSADYSGMDYSEIYQAIWDRYQDAFDGKMPAITSCLIGREDWANINNQFVSELNEAVYHPLYQKIYTETGLKKGTQEFSAYWKEHYAHTFSSAALGYEGMTADEKEQAIYEKYAGKGSLYDFASMMGELKNAGILSDRMGDQASFSYMNMMGREILYRHCPNSADNLMYLSDQEWADIMYQPFDAQKFVQGLKDSLNSVTFKNWGFDIQETFFKELDKLYGAIS